MSALLALLQAAPSVEVLVVGDAVLDGWLSGPTTRLSREAPVPVVDVRSEEYAAGGAANTAVNLAALGARVRFLSVVGDDEDGVRLRTVLRAAGVGVEDVLVEPGRRTCAKRRISASGQMVTRFDTGDAGPLAPATLTRLATRLHRYAEQADAVVVSDYGLGVLPDAVVGQVASLRHPCVVVDARAPLRWSRVRPRAVKPNFDEVAPLLGPGADRAERVVAAAPAVLDAFGAEIVCVTLDTDGCVVLGAGQEPVRLQARPQPHDHAAGAGDSFTAALAVGLAAGGRPVLAAGLAQAAAQVVVQRRGTTADHRRRAARRARPRRRPRSSTSPGCATASPRTGRPAAASPSPTAASTCCTPATSRTCRRRAPSPTSWSSVSTATRASAGSRARTAP